MPSRSLAPALGLLALMSLAACPRAESQAQAAGPETAQVRVRELATELFTDELRLPATLQARQVAVLVPDVPGRVASVAVRIGDVVRKGDVLLTLEDGAYRQGLLQAEAGLRLAQVGLSRARSARDRTEQLHATGVVMDVQRDDAQHGADLAEAQVAQAEAGAAVARDRLADTQLRAPFSGVVIARNVEQGEMLGGPSARPPLQLADLSKVRAVASIGELDAARIQPGQAVVVDVEALGAGGREGVVERVNAAVDPMSRTVRVEALLDNHDGLFKHGMSASVRIPGAGQERVALPRIALIDPEDGGARVFVVEDGVARSREVGFGPSFSDRVPVSRGLRAGERVVVAGQSRLRDGAVIEVMPEPR